MTQNFEVSLFFIGPTFEHLKWTSLDCWCPFKLYLETYSQVGEFEWKFCQSFNVTDFGTSLKNSKWGNVNISNFSKKKPNKNYQYKGNVSNWVIGFLAIFGGFWGWEPNLYISNEMRDFVFFECLFWFFIWNHIVSHKYW